WLAEVFAMEPYRRFERRDPDRSYSAFSAAVVPASGVLAEPLFTSLRDFDHGHGVDQAVGQHEIAFSRDRGVAHDVATTRDRPTLEFRSFGIEAHDRIRGRPGFAVPDDVVDRRDAVGLGLRPARRRPLGHLAGRGIETAQIAPREVAVPDDIVAGDRDTPWAGSRIRQRVLTNFQSPRIDASHFVVAERNVEHGPL